MFGQIVDFIVNFVSAAGYLGIFAMMFLESSFVPFPSEVVMIPAGYLAYKGEMNAVIAVIAGIAGSLAGALFNYYLAIKFGRDFLIRFGKYFFFTESTMQKMENYFKKHGEVSTFIGRLIMGVRQYISLPAGLARMNLAKFSFYTSLGAGIWVVILTILGWYIGKLFGSGFEVENIIHAFTSKELDGAQSTIKSYAKLAGYATLVFVCAVGVAYVLWQKFKASKVKRIVSVVLVMGVFIGGTAFFALSNKAPKIDSNNKFVALHLAYLQMLDSQKNAESSAQNSASAQSQAQLESMEEAIALKQRADNNNYKLIDSESLASGLNDFVIIATLPRGIYNLGLIPNAKHFGFSKSLSLNEDGSEWNWKEDSQNGDMKQFVEFLGANKGAKIVFYDEGDSIFAPAGSAHTAILWAQHLGYTELYRLVGGFGAWKALGKPITTQMPECCELSDDKAHDHSTHGANHEHSEHGAHDTHNHDAHSAHDEAHDHSAHNHSEHKH